MREHRGGTVRSMVRCAEYSAPVAGLSPIVVGKKRSLTLHRTGPDLRHKELEGTEEFTRAKGGRPQAFLSAAENWEPLVASFEPERTRLE
jgi:hypothetical protein